MVAGISPSVTSVAAGTTPPGGVVLANRSGTHAYAPLCPAKGQDDTFEFTLYALSSPSGLTAGSDANARADQGVRRRYRDPGGAHRRLPTTLTRDGPSNSVWTWSSS